MDVRAMCAIGRRGQLGLRGRLPWEGQSGPEFQADVARFWDATRGHVLLAGPATYHAIPDPPGRSARSSCCARRICRTEVLAGYPGRTVFIGGGPPVWAAWARLIGHWDVTRLPYDGPADRWFDPAWLTAG